MNPKAVVVTTLLLVASSVVPVGAAASADTTTEQERSAYAGTNIAFETSSDAIVDYRVNDDTVIESMKVQSQERTESDSTVSVGTDLSAVTTLSGAAVSLDSRTEVGATVTTDSGATVSTHDNAKGILVVEPGNSSQYVSVNVSDETETEQESDRRVAVTTANGTEGAFVVAGNGSVTVNERGNVSADLPDDGSLVFRSYPGGRDDGDREEERLIADGTAAAEVTVMQASEGSSDLAADVAQYGEDTTVEVTQTAEGTVNMTATRAQEEGRVVISSISEQAISSTADLRVFVDGEAAVEASSYSELETATEGGERSRYLVRQQSGASASADVLVAVNHFSTRELSMQSGSEDGTTSGEESETDSTENGEETTASGTDTTDGASGGSGPGFGLVAALLAVVGAAAIAVRRRE